MGTNNRIPEQRERTRRMAEERYKAEAAAKRIERWNAALTALASPSPTIGDALLTGHHWLRVFCPGCQTSNAVDLRRIDRHRNAPVESLTLSLKCSCCRDRAPMPRLLGLYYEPSSRSRDRTG